MPVDRSCVLSISQFCELLALDPARFTDVEVDRRHQQIVIVQEPEMQSTKTPLNEGFYVVPGGGDVPECDVSWSIPSEADMQTSGTFPALTKGGKKIGGKRPGKRGC
jgi:hypothetical protein